MITKIVVVIAQTGGVQEGSIKWLSQTDPA